MANLAEIPAIAFVRKSARKNGAKETSWSALVSLA
jgi:hypothetical protein